MGDNSEHAYVILDGEVGVYLLDNFDQKPNFVLGKNEVFGELGILNNQLRTSNVKSITEVELLKVSKKEMNKMISGTLNLVDLAGSERLDRSNATGQTAKEAVAINKSLSSLTDVFAAIGEHSKHVPFRNSKLTYLLQPCFSGDGKTLMVVNISPTEESVQESMCSLRFASSVNKCELGKAKRTFTKVR